MTHDNITQASGRKRPWIFRTYAGHSAARDSNTLFRSALERGQTGLSVAFDLPTQLGLDADDLLARGEVGKTGVPISHLGDMRTLFEALPLERMNTSMTINATAPWLLALYAALAEEQGADPARLTGTTQNDIIKEYLARGTYIFPPEASLRLTGDVIAYCSAHMPKFNPVNICSYHLQEAGAKPEQELAFALAAAQLVLDWVRDAGAITPDRFPLVVGRISFFVNAGMKIIAELCKMRAFCEMWDDICRTRYGVDDEKLRRFRYGVQVNSLGLTEQQPENNVYRILIEMLPVVLSKSARARAVQLPAWNEALGLPRPWDQQWSLRSQQIMAYETDLLDYGDIFDGSLEITNKTEDLKAKANALLEQIDEWGGMLAALEAGHIKQALVESQFERLKAIERGEEIVVGVNAWREGEVSPLATDGEETIVAVSDLAEAQQIADLKAWRAKRDDKAAGRAIEGLKTAATSGDNIMPASIAAAKAGVTTGEWGAALREVFGEYRAPTGLNHLAVGDDSAGSIEALKARVEALSKTLGTPLCLLVAKPGLDGHSNGAEQIAIAARACGIDTHYDGIRQTPEDIVAKALGENVHMIGLSVLSGGHVAMVREVMSGLRAKGRGDVPVVVGGIIPEADALILRQLGVTAIFTPKDFSLETIMDRLITLAEARAEPAA
jgi:(2R)-ethylmalonyl-CoA mutase